MLCVRQGFRRVVSSGRQVRRLSTVGGGSKAATTLSWSLLLGGITLGGAAGYYTGFRKSVTSINDNLTSVDLHDVRKRIPVKFNSTYGTPEDFQRAIEELRRTIPLSDETVSTDPGVLQSHGVSMNDYHPGEWRSSPPPEVLIRKLQGSPHTVVVFPNSTEDVVKVVNISRKYKMPIVPFAGGTGLEGNCSGVCMRLLFPSTTLRSRICYHVASWRWHMS
jgi:hypothetical protein